MLCLARTEEELWSGHPMAWSLGMGCLVKKARTEEKLWSVFPLAWSLGMGYLVKLAGTEEELWSGCPLAPCGSSVLLTTKFFILYFLWCKNYKNIKVKRTACWIPTYSIKQNLDPWCFPVSSAKHALLDHFLSVPLPSIKFKVYTIQNSLACITESNLFCNVVWCTQFNYTMNELTDRVPR